jgi:hypothetical protein
VTTPAPAAEPSPIDAAVQAVEHTRRVLLPFRFETWLALGFVAFLDQCGRGGLSGSVPGGGGRGPVRPGKGGDGGNGLPDIGAWVDENLALLVVIAAGALALMVAFSALVLWINSRATFVYIDDVASGRAEIARPWKAHAALAWSYFGWRFGLVLAIMLGAIVLIVAGAFVVVTLKEQGAALAAALLVLIPLFLALIIGAALFSVLLRDFTAPIQLARGLTCGAALAIAWGLVRAHPLPFFLYVVLKVCYGVAQGIVIFAAACLTCCCALIPVVTQTALQPLFFFERAWPLFLLRQMGYDLVTAAAPVPPPLAPPPPTMPPPPTTHPPVTGGVP